MSKKKKKRAVDTEPDDAFAAVLGDINASPLMQGMLQSQPENNALPADIPDAESEEADPLGLSPLAFPQSRPSETPPDSEDLKDPEAQPEPEAEPGPELPEEEPTHAAEQAGQDEEPESDRENGPAITATVDSEALRLALLASLEQDEIVVNLGDLEQLDATGLAVIIGFTDLMRESGREDSLVLEGAGEELERLFALCRLVRGQGVIFR